MLKINIGRNDSDRHTVWWYADDVVVYDEDVEDVGYVEVDC